MVRNKFKVQKSLKMLPNPKELWKEYNPPKH